MSKIFYDHLIILEEVDRSIKNSTETQEEKEELWQIVDEIIHHRVLGCVLAHLPREHHEEFLEKFHQAPHDEALLDYLKEKIKKDITKLIREEMKFLSSELI